MVKLYSRERKTEREGEKGSTKGNWQVTRLIVDSTEMLSNNEHESTVETSFVSRVRGDYYFSFTIELFPLTELDML